MDKDFTKKVYEKIEGYREEMIDLQSKLTAIPALGPTNDGEGEEKKAAFIKGWMEKEVGFDELEQHDSPDELVPSGKRPNIVAIVKGEWPIRTSCRPASSRSGTAIPTR